MEIPPKVWNEYLEKLCKKKKTVANIHPERSYITDVPGNTKTATETGGKQIEEVENGTHRDGTGKNRSSF